MTEAKGQWSRRPGRTSRCQTSGEAHGTLNQPVTSTNDKEEDEDCAASDNLRNVEGTTTEQQARRKGSDVQEGHVLKGDGCNHACSDPCLSVRARAVRAGVRY